MPLDFNAVDNNTKIGERSDLPDGLSGLLETMEPIERIEIRPGTKFDDDVLRVDLIVFYPSADLTLGNADSPFIAIVAEKVVFQDGNQTCRIVIPSKQAASFGTAIGRPNKPTSTVEGEHGENGENGRDGETGPPLPPLVFWANEIEFLTEPTNGVPPLQIFGNGVVGGNGETGGSGGDGGDGGPGRSGRMRCEPGN